MSLPNSDGTILQCEFHLALYLACWVSPASTKPLTFRRQIAVSFLAMLATAISVVTAQNSFELGAMIEQLKEAVPQCAFTCMLSEIPKSTCKLSDIGCICTNVKLANSLLGCMSLSCSVVEQLQTQRYQMSMCGSETRNIGGDVKAITWSLFGLATLFTGLRIVGRVNQLFSTQSWDDWTIVACTLALLPSSVIGHLMVDSGLGQDIWMLTPEQITNTLFYFFVEEFLYTVLVVFTKLAILLLYLRIFTTRAFRATCYVLIAIVCAFGVSCVISTGFNCRPISYTWTQWDGEHEGTCMDINLQTRALAGINMTLDIIIFFLPVYPLWRLQMNWRKKLAVSVMFVVGLFVTITSALRVQTILNWAQSVNPTYDYTHLAVWSLVEIDIGVICACMPGVAALLKRVWPKNFNSTVGSSGGGQQQQQGQRQKQLNSFGSSATRGSRGLKNTSKTTSASVSYNDEDNDGKSEELELVDHHIYRQAHTYTHTPQSPTYEQYRYQGQPHSRTGFYNSGPNEGRSKW